MENVSKGLMNAVDGVAANHSELVADNAKNTLEKH